MCCHVYFLHHIYETSFADSVPNNNFILICMSPKEKLFLTAKCFNKLGRPLLLKMFKSLHNIKYFKLNEHEHSANLIHHDCVGMI